MLSLLLSICAFIALIGAAPVEKRQSPSFSFAGDVPWSVSTDVLAASLNCPLGLPNANSPPVLLVHGTMASGNLTWTGTYVPALQADGYTACYIEIPYMGGVDMQVAAEYVAYNLHYISYLSGGLPTAVITHSQGGPDTQWALEWWPSLWNITTMFLPLAPDLLGVTMDAVVFNTICPSYMCAPSIWQQMTGSRFESALRIHNFKALVPATLVWTANDEIVTPPNQNALLPGGTTIGVQDVCPGHVIDHIYLIADAPAYAVMQDAMAHNGTADVARVLANNPDVCKQFYAPKMKPSALQALELVAEGAVSGFVLGMDRVASEPPLMKYVYGNSAN